MGEQGTRGLMTVGELASRVGVTVRTIQYYDQRGLLHPTCKGEQNLRLYSPADEERLNRIITLKYLGFSLSQIQEGEGSDSLAELTDALAHREAELERESAKILRDMNVVQGLRAHLANRDQANWSELAATVGVAQDREDMLWSAITGEALEECPIPELSREEVICWHQLMGDTIEAMHDGVLVTDDRAKALAIRFSSLGGMPHAPCWTEAPRVPAQLGAQAIRPRLLRRHSTPHAQLPARRARLLPRQRQYAGITTRLRQTQYWPRRSVAAYRHSPSQFQSKGEQ